MPLDYRAARANLDNLRFSRAFGSGVELPNGQEMMVLGPAIHSETLECLLVVLDTASGQARAMAPGAARPGDDFTGAEAIVLPSLSRAALRHRKGGVYTRLCPARSAEGEMIVYVSHADGVWWIRPADMFADGRFEECRESPLSFAEIFG